MTSFEMQVGEALRAVFREMRLVRAGRQDDALRWSADDLATDLAPRVAAAIDRTREAIAEAFKVALLAREAQQPLSNPHEERERIQQAALAALRGEP